jgi:pimeloyl-ACP methyl ester carboxylesterase
MGGAAALEAARRLGPRCSLVLGVDTFTDAAFYRRRPRAEVEARKQAFADDFRGTMEKMVRRIAARSAERHVVDWIVGAMAGAEPQTALLALDALLAWDIEARWPSLRSPVETINSAALAKNSEQIALDGLRVHAMDAAGHFPMLEDPERFNALTQTILERHRIG